ncbi:MAG: ferredoxin [Candidatus Helarchaeota archaeon]
MFIKTKCFSLIIDQDLCIGCGVCAAICPICSLSMKLNEKGQFI